MIYTSNSNGLSEEIINKLIETAKAYRRHSYAPYSHYNVGAAVLDKNGNITGGCNIENAAYSPGICAERNAVYKAVSEWTSDNRIIAVAIAGSPEGEEITQYAFPCGVCRQVIREFADPEECLIIVAGPGKDREERTLEDLLPDSFGPDNLA